MSDESKPIQIIRSDTVAISYETRKGLRYVARALGMPNPDALAEQILWEWLKNNHNYVVIHINRLDEEESKFEQWIKATINPAKF